ncbi:type II CRISPR RNA-guided endonuclease Cas9 [Lutibacter holmesii]|uniref:CRISPR-associated endonuclease Cas9 n=1 Tax=Lutibacter holmesii TaxID=1137985 RepID=A0ABW3WMG4_9FLAO
MKTILGLDLGTTSIGWALVKEAENEREQSEIIKLGVRVNPLTTDEQTDFEKGRPLSVNADRTLKRGARRNLQRFKLRRQNLIEILLRNNFISDDTPLTEVGENSTFETLALRSKSASEKIELDQLSKVLLSINKKRGYKSSRKAKNEDEGSIIDGMAVAKELYDNNYTPGQYVLNLLKSEKKYIPDFYRSDLQTEFDIIWNFQKQFYPEILIDSLYKEVKEKNKGATWKICEVPFNLVGLKRTGSAKEKRLEQYKWRVQGLSEQLQLEHLIIVLQDINNDLNKSSGYLGAISDRSKELYFNKETIGENLYNQIKTNPHTSLKNQVFYRQDYLDEFEQIWETQAKFHPKLTLELKEKIRDVIIFYQRKLKSQKGLISICQFEKRKVEVLVDNIKKIKEVGPRVIPKSSLLFQEFKIWQNLNNLEFKNSNSKTIIKIKEVDDEIRQRLFDELDLRGDLKSKDILNLLSVDFNLGKISEWKCNFEKIEGNTTNKALYNIYQAIVENEGYGFDWNKKSAKEIKEELKVIFPEIGIDSSILNFDAAINGNDFDQQSSYQLWHLLYSAEDDNKVNEEDKIVYGNSNVSIKKKLYLKYGFQPNYASLLANISLQQDYGSLSSRAIKKILPFLKEGNEFSVACGYAKYNHSNSLTSEELATRPLKDKLELIPKNSLRNPVVEKILNQMVNVINQVIDTYGKPDEIRIELARELKKSAKERAEATKYINSAKSKHDAIRKLLQSDFGIKNPTRNDLIRYKLYEELSENGYKTLFTNTYIPKEKLFSKDIDIEHIIPKAILFDDSFSNKTLAYRKVNLAKGDSTAIDFIRSKYPADLEAYKERVTSLLKADKISKGKYKKLQMSRAELPDGFIERDLRNSQYISKKSKQLLEEVFRTVNTTTGSITDKLRDDWGLINVMKELNLPKYKALGLTEMQERKEGKFIEQIKDWTKRNDHRHHAMDALTVAFTSYNHVQYLNNLNTLYGLKDSEIEHNKSNLKGIKDKVTKIYESKNGRKKRLFIPPIPNFRTVAKDHLEQVLISFKAKNKVVTKNSNKIKVNKGVITKVQLTPRGQLHKETIYGKLNEPIVKIEKVSAKFDRAKIKQVTKPLYRKALLERLEEFNNDPKKAFAGKNSLVKNPIYINSAKTEKIPEIVKTKSFESNYTIRKEINPDNFKDIKSLQKVIDVGVRKILENRLIEYNNKPKEAFSNLNKNPIWLNKNKTIAIKRVTISGVKNAEALHIKKDHFGQPLLDEKGSKQAVDFVSTGNNHHVSIYKDEKGKLQEKVVSFYEAVTRVNENLPIIDKHFNEALGWEFLFTMKQNEMFVFPSEGFNLNEIDLLDKKNAKLISKQLFRVQKFTTKDYFFRHHLETTVENNKETIDIAWVRTGLSGLEGIIKVRTNHLGQIVQVGEY